VAKQDLLAKNDPPRARRRFTAEFKAMVALEVIKGYQSAAELDNQAQVAAHQITAWKREATGGR
jgi:transposase